MAGRLRVIRLRENPARPKKSETAAKKVRTRTGTRLTRPKGERPAARFVIEAMLVRPGSGQHRYSFSWWTGHGLSPERGDGRKYTSDTRALAEANAAMKRYAGDPAVILMRVVPA